MAIPSLPPRSVSRQVRPASTLQPGDWVALSFVPGAAAPDPPRESMP
jgi:hypothetical protein